MNKSILKIISLLVFLMSGLTVQAQLKAHGHFQFDFLAKIPYGLNIGYEHWYGAEALYQYNLKNPHLTVNGGISIEMGKAHIPVEAWNFRDMVMLEAGIPVMLEILTGTNTHKNGMFFGVGATPTFYANVKTEETMEGTADYRVEAEKEHGWFISPKIEVGAYAPVFGDNVFRISAFGMYNLNLKDDNEGRNIFKRYMTRAMYGVSVGVMF